MTGGQVWAALTYKKQTLLRANRHRITFLLKTNHDRAFSTANSSLLPELVGWVHDWASGGHQAYLGNGQDGPKDQTG